MYVHCILLLNVGREIGKGISKLKLFILKGKDNKV